MREFLLLLEEKSVEENLEIVPLSYKFDDLQPVLSRESVKFHYDVLAKGYADKFNAGVGNREFQYAGYFLHNIWFTQFRPTKRNNVPIAPLGNFIKSRWDSWNNFTDKFTEEALKLEGSGWIYLATDGKIKTIHNHEVRNDIVILVDMWEHAFQPDYGSDKERYLQNIWRIMNWNMLNSRFGRKFKES